MPSFEVHPDDESDPEPVISGPSFLGLNKPARGRGGLGADNHGRNSHDHLHSSGSVDYLLDDEEEPKRGWRTALLIVVALALAGGFGYLHWKQGGFDWLNAGQKKPAAAQTSADAVPSHTDNGATAAAPNATSPVAGGTPVAGNGTSPTPGAAAATTSAENSPQQSAAPPTAPTASQPSAVSSQPAASENSAEAPAQAPNSPAKGRDSGTPAVSGSQAADSDSDKESSDEEQPPAPKPAEHKVIASKPTVAKPSAARPVESAAEGERYVYGRGVRQDCDRGLRMLKSAAGQSDAKAMISLGTLYTVGTCAPRDLPTAYRWFALALHKEPDNQALQDNLQRLWGQMTQPERQLAIKLSQ
jgi:hypothetical protein